MTRKLAAKDCPLLVRHASAPRGFEAWHEWAATMARTHEQLVCNGCGLFVVWTPKGTEPLCEVTTAGSLCSLSRSHRSVHIDVTTGVCWA